MQPEGELGADHSVPSHAHQANHTFGSTTSGQNSVSKKTLLKDSFGVKEERQSSGSQTFRMQSVLGLVLELLVIVVVTSRILIQEVKQFGVGICIPGNLYFVKDVGVGGHHS